MIEYRRTEYELMWNAPDDHERHGPVAGWDYIEGAGWTLLTEDTEILEAVLEWSARAEGVMEIDQLRQLILEVM